MSELNRAIWDVAFAKVEQNPEDEATAAAANGPPPPPPITATPPARKFGAPPSDFMDKSGFRPPLSPGAAAARERIERMREEFHQRRQELPLPPRPGESPRSERIP